MPTGSGLWHFLYRLVRKFNITMMHFWNVINRIALISIEKKFAWRLGGGPPGPPVYATAHTTLLTHPARQWPPQRRTSKKLDCSPLMWAVEVQFPHFSFHKVYLILHVFSASDIPQITRFQNSAFRKMH